MSAQIRKKNNRSKLVEQDFGRRLYATDLAYSEAMKKTTQKYMDSMMLIKQSEFEKPYREDDYNTMEYAFEPPNPPAFPPGPGWPSPDCTPKGDAVGGGSTLCEPGIECGVWIWNCAHKIIKLDVVQDFGWIQSIQYLPGDIVKVTVCWNEADRDAGRKIGSKIILAKGKSKISTFNFATCCPTTKACNGKCEGCPPPTIGYTSNTMACGATQTFTHTGGGSGGKYTWATNYGTFGPVTGNTVVFTAPASNAWCLNNVTISLTDCCGHAASQKIAINCLGAQTAGYLSCCVTGRVIGLCSWTRGRNNLYCDGTLAGSCNAICGKGADIPCTIAEYYAWLETGCIDAISYCNGNCPQGCSEGYRDARTDGQKTAGCCPEQFL